MSVYTYPKLLAKHHFEMVFKLNLKKGVKMPMKWLARIYSHSGNPFSSNVFLRHVLNASAVIQIFSIFGI